MKQFCTLLLKQLKNTTALEKMGTWQYPCGGDGLGITSQQLQLWQGLAKKVSSQALASCWFLPYLLLMCSAETELQI